MAKVKLHSNPNSLNIKLLLFIVAAFIAVGTLLYTRSIVEKLQNRERKIVELYAQSFSYITSSVDGNNDLTFIFENIIQRIDFPLVLTDSEDKINLSAGGGGVKNIDIDSTLSPEQQQLFIENMIIELGEINKPIPILYQDSIVLSKIYYGDSELVKRLRYYPYLQIIFAVIFLLMSYTGFSYLKRSEQSNIWVGMAKETAHQLGTPISSLMGWTEIIRMNYQNPDKVLDSADEIENDLTRLNKVTQRFSKIGSKPELKHYSVTEVIAHVISYYSRRLPQIGKNVKLELKQGEEIFADINPELFEWVIENLTKNAIDAIEGRNGEVCFTVQELKKYIEIEVSDNGKGLDMRKRKEIFRPGYSTKRRGWGLGLSLSKRIIKDYHNGKIFVKHSAPNEGTTFKIILKK